MFSGLTKQAGAGRFLPKNNQAQRAHLANLHTYKGIWGLIKILVGKRMNDPFLATAFRPGLRGRSPKGNAWLKGSLCVALPFPAKPYFSHSFSTGTASRGLSLVLEDCVLLMGFLHPSPGRACCSYPLVWPSEFFSYIIIDFSSFTCLQVSSMSRSFPRPVNRPSFTSPWVLPSESMIFHTT